MTFIEAAIIVLTQANNTPMSARQIWDEIAKQNMVSTNGKTPWATLDTLIRTYQKDSAINPTALQKTNPKSIIHFEAIGSPAKFKLISYVPVIVLPASASIVSPVIINKSVLYQITDHSFGWKTLSVIDDGGSTKYEISNCDEYTYMFEDAAHDTVKIGKTKSDPAVRLSQLRTGNPQITLSYVFPASRFTESYLHNMFSSFRKDLEWFFRTQALKNFISTEKEKHAKIIETYNQSVKVSALEKELAVMLATNKTLKP